MVAPHQAVPLAYFVTFTCYGTWLHGRDPGSVDREHNQYGEPFLEADARHESAMRRRLAETPSVLDEPRRRTVLRTIQEVSTHRRWRLLAAHVRTNHIHIIARASCDPDKVMEDYKAYATRRLKEAGFDAERRHRWTEGGSKRYLWTPERVEAAVRYVVSEQGSRLEVYQAPMDQDFWFGDLTEPDA